MNHTSVEYRHGMLRAYYCSMGGRKSWIGPWRNTIGETQADEIAFSHMNIRLGTAKAIAAIRQAEGRT